MSEATETTMTEDYIPAEDEVTSVGGGKSWRFANGKIVRGQEIENDEGNKTGQYAEEKKQVVGRLRRVGIFEGIGKTDEQPYSQVEADIETASGLIHIKSGLSDPDNSNQLKPSIATLTFVRGLLKVGKDELIKLVANRGEPVTLPNGKKGGRPTYANFERVDPVTKTANPIYGDKRPKDAEKTTALEQWLEMEAAFRAHPAYAERSAEGDEDSWLGALIARCKDWEWPHPEQAPAEWLQVVNLGLSKKYKALKEVPEDDWQEVTRAMSERVKKSGASPAPKPIQTWIDGQSKAAAPEKEKAATASEGGKDPFEDM